MRNKIDNWNVICWAIHLALDINKKLLIIRIFFCSLISVLPVIMLKYQQLIYNEIIQNISRKHLNFHLIIYRIIILSLILLIIDILSRINTDYIEVELYDSLNMGMENITLDTINKIPIDKFFDNNFMKKYRYLKHRDKSLTNFINNLSIMFVSFISIISLLLLTIKYSNKIFVITVIYFLVSIAINIKLSKKSEFNYLEYIECENRTRYYEDSVMKSGIAKEIRIFNTHEEIYREWENAYKPIKLMESKIGFWKLIDEIICGFGYYIFAIIFLIYSVNEIITGNMSVDVVITIYAITQSLSLAINSMSSVFQKINKDVDELTIIRESIKDLSIYQKENIRYLNLPPKCDNIIQVENVCFGYQNNKIIKNISFKIKKGEIVAFLGSNGSGKTTLAKLLMGLYTPSSGEIYFNGIPYSDIDKDSLKSRVGVYFQRGNIFHATVGENVGFGEIKQIENQDKIRNALKRGYFKPQIDLHKWVLRDVKKSGYMLSGGEKQKLGISRAYMNDKELLIFDEPASALDPLSEQKQFEEIRAQIRENTAILISHRVGFARLADRIIVIEDGSIVENGSHKELIKKKGVYFMMFENQAKWYTVTS